MAHSYVFLALSLIVAVFGAWTALDLFRRVPAHFGAARNGWLAAAGLTMGMSIWAMHFIAMLGYHHAGGVTYDVNLTLASLVLAVVATSGAFFAAAKSEARLLRVIGAGVAMGLGVCLMHYVGMAGLHTSAAISYDPMLVAASFAIAIGASIAALIAAQRAYRLPGRLAAAVALGLAVAGMHYTGMAAMVLGPASEPTHSAGLSPFALGFGVAAGTLAILFTALIASLYDQRINVLAALDAAGLGYWETTYANGGFHISARGKEIMGVDPKARFGYNDLMARLAPEERDRREQMVAKAVANGGHYDADYRLRDAPEGARWVNVRGKIIATVAGRPWRMTGIVLDVSERYAANAALAESQQRQRLLIDELNHRVKNTLTTVLSIASQTAKRAPSVEVFKASFQARIHALAMTHEILTKAGWDAADMRELAALELRPYDPLRYEVQGPDLRLLPKHALAFGLIFHELATNAAKYGALSTLEGHVEVRWRVDNANAILEVAWLEADGPPVATPAAKGFGSELIRRVMEGELGGSAELNYNEQGFSARLVCRLPEPSPMPSPTTLAS